MGSLPLPSGEGGGEGQNTPPQSGAPAKRIPRWLGFLIALALLAGAAVAIATNAEDFTHALDAMAHATWWQWVALPGAMLAALLLTAAVFSILTRQYGRVGYTEMNALIGVAWTVNFLPMHPGMFGRLAYHKKVNNIPLRDSMRVLIWANVQTLVAVAILPAIAYASAALAGASESTTLALLQIPAVTCFALAAILAKSETRPHAWRFFTAFALRFIEFELWAARYWLSFTVIGMPITFSASVLIAAVVIIASMIAITGNGMGIQEWAVALVTPLLPLALVATDITNADGLIGAFLSRAAEIAVAIPCGLWGMWYIARLQRRTP